MAPDSPGGPQQRHGSASSPNPTIRSRVSHPSSPAPEFETLPSKGNQRTLKKLHLRPTGSEAHGETERGTHVRLRGGPGARGDPLATQRKAMGDTRAKVDQESTKVNLNIDQKLTVGGRSSSGRPNLDRPGVRREVTVWSTFGRPGVGGSILGQSYRNLGSNLGRLGAGKGPVFV